MQFAIRGRPLTCRGPARHLLPTYLPSLLSSQLEARCQHFQVAGFNAYDLVELTLIPSGPPPPPSSAANSTAPATTASSTVGGLSGEALVHDSLAQAAALGLNTVRTWAHTSNPDAPFQVCNLCRMLPDCFFLSLLPVLSIMCADDAFRSPLGSTTRLG